MHRQGRKLVVLFLLSFTVLMLEICLTRIFSVLSWHHFAYLIISLALLGFGAAGSYISVSKNVPEEKNTDTPLAKFASLFALTLIAAIFLLTKIRFYPTDIITRNDYSNAISLLILYILMGIPFFFAGVCICRLVALAGDKVNLFYFADLAGAGSGALMSLFVINYIGAVGGIFLGASLAALSALILAFEATRLQRFLHVSTILGAFAFSMLAVFTDFLPLYYPPSKDLFRDEHKIVYSKWHITGKIDITSPESAYVSFGGALSRRYRDNPPVVRGIYQDGAAPTGIMAMSDRPETSSILGEYLQGIPYVVQPAQKVLVIGVGGGIDALIALYSGSSDVLGVDLNPIIVNAVERKYRDECTSLWLDDRFRIIVSEGRHFLSRNTEKFDVIQLSGVDTYTALSSGAYALAENFLYTTEAMAAYWAHLTEYGILSFSRWLFEPPRESLRLVTTQLHMLDTLGIEDPPSHFVVVAGPAYYNRPPWAEVLLKRTSFTKDQIGEIQQWATERQFDVLYDPFTKRSNAFDGIIRANQADRVKMIADYRFNISPTTDDDPFFFQFYRWKSVLEMTGARDGLADSKGGYSMTRIPLGFIILAFSLFQMMLLSIIFIIAPLCVHRRLHISRPGRFGVFLYFAALGLAFISIEIALLQKYSVFVGGPVYSMAVTLASMLFFSGLGSFIARNFKVSLGRSLVIILVLVVVLVFVQLWIHNLIVDRLLFLNHPVRCLVTILAIAPLALVMGMPFPTGLRIIQRTDPAARPWAWAVNSFATVIGSIVCVLLSIHFGFTVTIITGAVVYLVGGLGLLSSVKLSSIRATSTF